MGFWKGKHERASSAGGDVWKSSNGQGDKLMSVTSTISKPFNLMSIDELLEALPGCNQGATKELWIPEMRKKIAATKVVVQTAELRSFHSHESLIVMEGVSSNSLYNRTALMIHSKDLAAIGSQAKQLTQLYEQVVKSAELLAEKNVVGLKQQVDEVEDRLLALDAENQHLRSEAKLRSKEANAAKYNVYAVVDSVRDVLEKALRFPQHWDRVQCHSVHQVLQDYPPDHDQPDTVTLRLPQQTYHQLVADLRDAQAAVASLRSVTRDQGKLITEQSVSLSKAIDRYEEKVQVLATRNHEILLLDERNQELEGFVHECQDSLHAAEKDRAHTHMLQQQLNQVTQKYDKRLEEKDAALLKMSQDLDKAQKQLITAQIDLRNMTTTRLMAGSAGLNKPRPSLPSSYSSFALNVRQLSEQAAAPRTLQTYKILGLRQDLPEPQQANLVLAQSPSVAQSLAQPVRSRRLSDPFRDAQPITRARGNSLDSGEVIIHRPNDGGKPLPSPPTITAEIPASASLGRTTQNTDGPAEADGNPKPSPRFHLRDPHAVETPASGKRMLSLIAEASQEGSGSAKSVSATSSEQHDYRSSINALEILNSQSSPASQGSGSPVMHASWAEPRRRGGNLRKVASHELDVSKMYHQNRPHL